VRLGDLWQLYTHYPYLPRLRDRSVLDAGVVNQPLIWDHDGFALAEAFDEASGRYQGLWTPGSGSGAPPATTDALLLVRPDVAEAQIAEDIRKAEAARRIDNQVSPLDQDADVTDIDFHPGLRPRPRPEPEPSIVEETLMRRFFGVKTLNADRLAHDIQNIVAEVIPHLREPGVDLTVRIEIEATKPDGFAPGEVRTVSENAKVLKFDQSSFEEQ